MIWFLILAIAGAAWAYHCWAVWRAFKAGMHEGGEHVIRQVSAW